MIANRSALRLGLVAAAWFLTAAPADAEFLYGLTTTNRLVTLDSASPGTITSSVAISGLGASETLYDIDLRPANGLLYGFSSSGNLYVINTTTGLATINSSLTGVTLDPAATRFGIDFNPTVDRLRIVSNTGQDLRLTPGTGTTTIDTALNLNLTPAGAASVAYTNSNATATATTLFYLGMNPVNTLYNTINPNGGVLSTVGGLGFTSANLEVGFDISGPTGIGYATLSNATGGGSSLYSINLGTGAATLLGAIDGGLTLRGLAAPVGVPEPASLAMLALGLGGVGLVAVRRRRLAA